MEFEKRLSAYKTDIPDLMVHVFGLRNDSSAALRSVTNAEYYADVESPVAPRSAYGALALTKIEDSGFSPRDWREKLEEYSSSVSDGRG